MAKSFSMVGALVGTIIVCWTASDQFLISAGSLSNDVQPGALLSLQKQTPAEDVEERAVHAKEIDELRTTLSGLQATFMVQQATLKGQQDKIGALADEVKVLRKAPVCSQATHSVVATGNSSETLSSENHRDKRSSSSGATYIRWGRTECAAGSTIVYDGYAATSRHNNAAGGSEMICLHRTPTWVSPISGATSIIVGVEYQFGNTPFSASSNGGRSLVHNDMPCVVCQAKGRFAQVMIPARHSCPGGWTREYLGYLVSTYHTKGAYTCLDSAPEAATGGSAYASASLIYTVTTQCGMGPICPPYINGYAIACVVCSM